MNDDVELKGWHDSKNSKVLAEFMKYCYEHPEMRFWQALKNWSGHNYILTAQVKQPLESWRWLEDTYYKEGK